MLQRLQQEARGGARVGAGRVGYCRHLDVISYFLGFIFTNDCPTKLVQHWGNGFWVLLSFGMQMCLIIMTGYILATTPIFSRALMPLPACPKVPKDPLP